MTRQLVMGTHGLPWWWSTPAPLPRGILTFTKEGIVATGKGWAVLLFAPEPWSCRYTEIRRAEAVRLSALMTLLMHPGLRDGLRIDRGPWTTRLIFFSDSAPDILAGLQEMGVTVETRPRRLGLHNLYGRS